MLRVVADDGLCGILPRMDAFIVLPVVLGVAFLGVVMLATHWGRRDDASGE